MTNRVNRHEDARALDYDDASTSTAVEVDRRAAADDHSAQEATIGTDSPNVSDGNVSWGAIIAGVVTFLGIIILLGIGAGAMGLQGSSGTATGIFTVIGLIVAFLAAGYVSGALGVRAGLFHGFATWASSLIATLILVGWLGTSIVGGAFGVLGNVVGTAAETASNAATVTSEDAENAADAAQDRADEVTQEDIDNARDEARDRAEEARDNARDAYNEYAPQAAAGTWWTFAGLLLGAVLSTLAGAAGARSVINRKETSVVTRK
ncbi:hypothetical protein [Corynebacterium aquatimens]|uniref:Vacuolar-type H+-ATPase subunit H n=1 Tax=Corynebacterium aquatimens TaxID=1190508 RepID=A0A931DYW2_9CORY|nr:hypothetical protein [Corynebacterium aquatimens]MBG6122942.1 vacuolar-type H+-ATPase subunit H [Corynebacterium aquatimens]WJY66723.1 hypothetical protein CAQUA_10180 [Corynebacterium aquatimens]